ncbi:MAG: TonB-dependent receptor, partial [Flaviaesturariibacter sp.]|nr:TonB-dependent receptor [Flaviaesturariibacter sp.]
MKMKIALLCAFLLLQGIIVQSFAQNRQISGKVSTQTNGNPLAGATVSVKGTNVVTTTDQNGNFSLNVPSGSKSLVISYIGMNAQEIAIPSSNAITVSLAEQTNTMNEVVVVGYGTQKKSVVTGAISSVRADDIDNQPIARIEQFLQGRASGLTIAASSGQPGAGSTLRVRGTTTMNGGNDPLYVVDG